VPAAAVDMAGKRTERMLLAVAILLMIVPGAYFAVSLSRPPAATGQDRERNSHCL